MYIFRADPGFGNRIKEKGSTYRICNEVWICQKVPDNFLSTVDEEIIYYDHCPKDRRDFDTFERKLLCGKKFISTYKMPDQYKDIHLCVSDQNLYICRAVPALMDQSGIDY